MNLIDADEFLEFLRITRIEEREKDFPYKSWETIDYIKEKIEEMKNTAMPLSFDDWNNEPNNMLSKVLNIIGQYGGIQGDHHKAWLLNEILILLLGEKGHKEWVERYEGEEDDEGDKTYSWELGIAP